MAFGSRLELEESHMSFEKELIITLVDKGLLALILAAVAFAATKG